jgi:GAF domain
LARTADPGTRRTVRTVTVVVLTALAMAWTLPDIVLPWHPLNIFGFTQNDGTISSVWPGYSAEQAGLHVGDRIDLKAVPMDVRSMLFRLIYASAPEPGARLVLPVIRGNEHLTIAMTSRPMVRSLAENASDIALNVASAIFFIIAAALVLLRPSRMTWAFFLFAIGTSTGSGIVDLALSLPGVVAVQGIATMLGSIALACFVSFALRFPTDQLAGWRRGLEVLCFAVAAAGGALSIYGQLTGLVTGVVQPYAQPIASVLSIAFGIVGVSAFFITSAAAAPADRQKIRWVLFGLIVGFGGGVLTSLPFTNTTVWLYNVAHSLIVALPITLAYVIIRHRVIDVNFLISRTIVYAGITSIIVAVFGVIDWFFNHYLSLNKAGVVAEVGTAIGLGFWLQGLHAQVDRLIDTVFFRRRHDAEVRIKRLARALPHATNVATVADSLVDRPADALDLTSAAFFVRTESDDFDRVRDRGWNESLPQRIAGDDLLVIQLTADHQPISLYRADYNREWMPGGAEHPALAMPISARNELRGFVLYGPHRRGDDLDPDEVSVLTSLCDGASAAMDHVEAAALQRKVEKALDLEREVELLRAEIAGLRSAPA